MTSSILHIGYPKTATKWFQEEFYPKLTDIYFVKRADVFNRFVFTDVFSYSTDQFKGWLALEAGSKRVVICDEILVGGLDIGFGNGEFAMLMSERLHEVLPDSQVVIFIRNQHTALESAYSHYIMSGGTYSPSRFLGIKPMFNKPFMGYHLFNPKLFEYSNLIEHYATLFGKDRVHVFLYEDFAENPHSFIAHFCSKLMLEFAGNLSYKRLNTRYSWLALQKQRFLNRFTLGNTPFKQYFINIPCLYRYSRQFTITIDRYFNLPTFKFDRKVHGWIESRFRKSNLSLTQWVAKEKLTHWGYPL